MSEAQEQCKLIKWVDKCVQMKIHPELSMLYAVPNGGRRDKAEAAEFTEEYKNNVEYASIKMHKEFDKTMALKYKGIDYGQKLRNEIDNESYLNLEIEVN